VKRDEVFPSKYLKSADLKGKPVVLTITAAPAETLKSPDGKEQTKTVLYFNGAKKSLPLNITNWDSVAEICGDDTDDWPGKKVELYPDKTPMRGEVVDCIRIRAPSQRELPVAAGKKRSVKAAKGRPESSRVSDIDDEIPY